MANKIGEYESVFISPGNDKLKKVANISTPPGSTCPPNAPCRKDCYAKRCYCRTTVKKAWDNNLKRLKENRRQYFIDIMDYICQHNVKFFRWHVSGDIPDQDYLDNMKILAEMYPDTKFLAFTKNFDLTFGRLPKNLSIVLSIWPGYKLPKQRLPRAYMQDGTETRVKNAIECKASCEDCGLCWSLKELGKNVVFDKH